MKPPSKILVFRQSSLGDVILTLPVLDKLRGAFPDCRIDYITKSPYKDVIQHHPAIERVFSFDRSNGFASIIGEIGSKRYDYFIDLQSNFRSLYVGLRLPGAKTLRYKKRRLARERIVRQPTARHAVEHTVEAYLRPLRKLGIETVISPPILHLSPEAIKYGREYVERNALTDKTIIALCPGAKHREKMWPPADYRDLALRLLDNANIAVILFRAATDNFPPKLGIENPRLFEAEGVEILKAGALLSYCRLAVTNDSGLMHLANSVGVKVVAIFGPTHPRLGFAPTLAGSAVVCDNVPCSPCSVHGERKCYQPRKYCFEKITAERVMAEIRLILGGKL